MSEGGLLSRRLLLLAALAAAGAPGCATAQRAAEPEGPVEAQFTNLAYADWSEYEPPYRFYPGDEVEVAIPSAPEFNKTQVVGPDGRITLGLIGQVMAADRTSVELAQAIGQAYSKDLLRPQAHVALKTATPLKVFVGGQVGNPGMFDMAGDSDALRAIIQAGDFKPTARRGSVVIIRRGPDGRGMMRTVNLSAGLKRPAQDLVPLRRFDIIYVPRSRAAEAALFVQQYFRDLSPIQFGFNYALNGLPR